MNILYKLIYFGVNHEVDLIMLDEHACETLSMSSYMSLVMNNKGEFVYTRRYDIDKDISIKFLEQLKRE